MARPACESCGSIGARHKAKCPLPFKRDLVRKRMVGAGRAAARKREPITLEEYGDIRESMLVLGRRFSVARYSLSRRVHPREVAAVKESEHYDQYLSIR